MSTRATMRPGDASRIDTLKDDRAGQGTVEYAVVALVVMAIALGMYAIWSLAGQGTLVEHAADSAAHSLGAYQMLRDTFLF